MWEAETRCVEGLCLRSLKDELPAQPTSCVCHFAHGSVCMWVHHGCSWLPLVVLCWLTDQTRQHAGGKWNILTPLGLAKRQ